MRSFELYAPRPVVLRQHLATGPVRLVGHPSRRHTRVPSAPFATTANPCVHERLEPEVLVVHGVRGVDHERAVLDQHAVRGQRREQLPSSTERQSGRCSSTSTATTAPNRPAGARPRVGDRDPLAEPVPRHAEADEVPLECVELGDPDVHARGGEQQRQVARSRTEVEHPPPAGTCGQHVLVDERGVREVHGVREQVRLRAQVVPAVAPQLGRRRVPLGAERGSRARAQLPLDDLPGSSVYAARSATTSSRTSPTASGPGRSICSDRNGRFAAASAPR